MSLATWGLCEDEPPGDVKEIPPTGVNAEGGFALWALASFDEGADELQTNAQPATREVGVSDVWGLPYVSTIPSLKSAESGDDKKPIAVPGLSYMQPVAGVRSQALVGARGEPFSAEAGVLRISPVSPDGSVLVGLGTSGVGVTKAMERASASGRSATVSGRSTSELLEALFACSSGQDEEGTASAWRLPVKESEDDNPGTWGVTKVSVSKPVPSRAGSSEASLQEISDIFPRPKDADPIGPVRIAPIAECRAAVMRDLAEAAYNEFGGVTTDDRVREMVAVADMGPNRHLSQRPACAVAFCGGGPVGYVWMGEEKDFTLFVKEDYRDEGIGRELLKRVGEEAMIPNLLSAVRVAAMCSNTARLSPASIKA